MNKNYSRGESGQVIILLALLMIALLGFAGLAIDGGNVLTQRRRGQNAVDNAALAYALSCMRNPTCTTGTNITALGQVNTVLASNGYANGTAITSTIVITATSTGGEVRITLTDTVPTAFIHIVYNGPVIYTVQAQAQWIGSIVPMQGFAITALGTTCTDQQGNLDSNGGGIDGAISAHNGDQYSNATGDCGIDAPNSANSPGITVDTGYRIVTVGNEDYSENPNVSQPVITGYNGGVPISDPLAGTPSPSCGTTAGSIVNGVYQPGWYGTGAGWPLSIGWGSYAPGIYCIDQVNDSPSGVNPSGNGTISGDNVLFYFKTGGMSFSGQQGIRITAATSSYCAGPPAQPSSSPSNVCYYQNMAIFADSSNSSTIEISGNGGSAVVGTIYGPNITLLVNGGGNTAGEQDIIGQVLVKRVQGTGNGTFDITYQEDKVYRPPPTIRLTK